MHAVLQPTFGADAGEAGNAVRAVAQNGKPLQRHEAALAQLHAVRHLRLADLRHAAVRPLNGDPCVRPAVAIADRQSALVDTGGELERVARLQRAEQLAVVGGRGVLHLAAPDGGSDGEQQEQECPEARFRVRATLIYFYPKHC